jgi:hypothetical protein
MFHGDVKDVLLVATAPPSATAVILGGLQMGVIPAALAHGAAAWAVLGGIHSPAVAASPPAEAAPAALAVLPPRESPLAEQAAAAVPPAAEEMLATVKDALPLAESRPYVVVAVATVPAARRL